MYLPTWKIIHGALGASVTLRPGVRRADGSTVVYFKAATSAASAGIIEPAAADVANTEIAVEAGDELVIAVAGANPAAQAIKATFFYVGV